MGHTASACCCNHAVALNDDFRTSRNSCPGQRVEVDESGEKAGAWPPSPDHEGVPKEEDVPAVLTISRGQNGEASPAKSEETQEQQLEQRIADEVTPEKGEAASPNGAEEAASPPAHQSEATDEKEDQVAELGAGTPKKKDQVDKAKMLRRNLTTQAAGHGGNNILKDWNCTDAGIPKFIIKGYDETEAKNYLRMQGSEDALVPHVPKYAGEVEEEDGQATTKDGKPQRYMRLSNLLLEHRRDPPPHVMDCKLGYRSFTESEVSSKALREDLYNKMKDLAPNDLTPEENEAGAITKHRWMAFNDNFTSLASLGFRIDGICHTGADGKRLEMTKKDLKCIRTNDDCVKCIVEKFLPIAEVPEDNKIRADVAELILGELRELRQAMQQSKFVATHSLVGCSLLFITDAKGPSANVKLIDFAKTKEVPDGIQIDHMSPWKEGNHEDGILVGMDNMIKVFTGVLAQASAQSKPPSKKFWTARMWR